MGRLWGCRLGHDAPLGCPGGGAPARRLAGQGGGVWHPLPACGLPSWVGFACQAGVGPRGGRVCRACAPAGSEREPWECARVHAWAFHSGPHPPPVHGGGRSRHLRSWLLGERGPLFLPLGPWLLTPSPQGRASSAGLMLPGDPACGVRGAGPTGTGLSGCHLCLRDPGSCLRPLMRAGLRNGRKSLSHRICLPASSNQ